MKIIKLEIFNFASFHGKHSMSFDYSNSNIILIVGEIDNNKKSSNGAGKTAIFEAISWCLTGKSRLANVVSDNENRCWVDIEFMQDKQKYAIVRKEYKGKESLFLHNLDLAKELTLSTKRETEALIQKIIGMDYDLFCTTAYLKEGSFNLFTYSAPAKRKDLLMELLGLSGIFNNMLDDVKEKLDRIKRKYQEYHDKVSGLDLNEIDNEINSIVENCKIFLKNKHDILDEMNNESIKEKQVYEKYMEQKLLLNKIEDTLAQKNIVKDDLKGKITSYLSSIKFGVCPYCRQKNKKLISKLENDVNHCKQKLDYVFGEIDELKAKSIIVNKSMLKYKNGAFEYKKSTDKSYGLNEELHNVISSIEECNLEIRALREDKRTFNEVNVILNKLNEHLCIYEILQNAFSRNGIQVSLINGLLDYIEMESSSFLSLFSGSMKIKFETYRQLKSGKQKDTLDIYIINGTNKRLYESYSRGERFRADFAIRLAISKVFMEYTGKKLDFLLIDEISGLDDVGVSQLYECLEEANKMFSMIMVISHLSNFKEYFDNIIKVKKTGDNSRILMEAE